MCKKTLFALLVFAATAANAQENTTSTVNTSQTTTVTRCPAVYIGVGTGLENPFGLLGLNIDVPIIKVLSVNTGVGISTWGTKAFLEARYYLKPCYRGWAFGLGATYNTGLSNLTASMPTVNGRSENVILDLEPAANMYVGVYHFWTLGKRANRFSINTGYSIPFVTYNYSQVGGTPITQDGYDALKILAPGGLMLGIGFSFGIYPRH